MSKRFKEDFAKDDIWVAKRKSSALNIVPVSNAKANDAVRKLEPTTKSVEKDAKVNGRIFYFLPKNSKGVIVNRPIRVLRVVIGGTPLNVFYDAKDFEAEVQVSSFTGLDDLRHTMDEYGANGVLELSNIDNMDESISNMVNPSSDFMSTSGVGKAKSNTKKFENVDGYYRTTGVFPRGTVKKIVDVKVVPFYCGRTNTYQQRNLLIFDDGSAGAPNKWKRVSEGYSNLTNESLLDGLTENTSLLEFEGGYSNLTNESLLDGLTENTSLLEFEGNHDELVAAETPTPYVVTISGANGGDEYFDADGDIEYSNSIGDWFRGLFTGTKKLNAIPALADPNVFIVDAETMQKAYEESGSGKSYREWVESDRGREIIGALAQFTNIIVNRPTDTLGGGTTGDVAAGSPSGGGFSSDADKKKSETKILGMSPVTFGIVALGIIVIGSIVTYKIIKSKK